jgi:hypothetical protein
MRVARAARDAIDPYVAARTAIGALSGAHLDASPCWTKVALSTVEALEAGLYAYWYCDEYIVALAQPKFALDDRGRAHREDGPALEWPDGRGWYVWHGVAVPERVIMAPESLTPHEVQTVWNAEIRRIMIRRIGYERYIRETAAELIHEEPDVHGPSVKLWHLPQSDGRPIAVVECVNGTPEADGTRKRYFLQVSARHTRPLDAVAATYRMSRREYVAACGGVRT